MQDIIKKYNKHKIISNLGIVVSSLIIALGVNFLLIDGTQIGQNLKADVLGTNNNNTMSDLFFEKNDSKIVLKTSNNIEGAKSISLSMVYNPNNVELNNIISKNNQIINIGDENGIKSIIINLSEIKDINAKNSIMEFEVQKKNNVTENINIVNANFTDNTGEIYMFSTSGISF